MSNSTQMAEITQLAKGLAQSAQQSDSGDGSYMKFTKFGEWTWGTEAAEVEETSLWAVHPQGFEHGWIAWGDKAHNTAKQKLGETMVSATEPLPFEKDLPEVQGSWAQQISIQMICLNGMDKGTKILFNSCSTGGRKAYHNIVNEVVKQITSGRQDICPVVLLTSSHYDHSDYGKIFTPVMEVDSFKTLVELEAMLNSIEAEEANETAEALAQGADSDIVEEEDESPEEMKARLKAEAKAELKAEMAAEAKEPKVDAKAEVKKAEAKAEAKAKAKAEAKAEAAAELAEEAQASAGTDTKKDTVADLDAESAAARAAAQKKGEAKLSEEKGTDEKATTPRRRRRTPTA